MNYIWGSISLRMAAFSQDTGLFWELGCVSRSVHGGASQQCSDCSMISTPAENVDSRVCFWYPQPCDDLDPWTITWHGDAPQSA